MNVKFRYLYRDGANYKNNREIVFSNPNKKPIKFIESIIRKCLIENTWFIAKEWNLPDLHFNEYSWDPCIDHEWHEFKCINETSEPPTEKISIDIFLNQISLEKDS